MAYDFTPIRNPVVRRLLEAIFDPAAGHDHDGTNSALLSGGATVSDGAITNAKLADDVKVGSLAAFDTTAKTTVQAAVNEVVAAIGNMSTLDTTEKSVLVGAVNEVFGDMGDKGDLITTVKTNLVAAINEVETDAAGAASLAATAKASADAATAAVASKASLDGEQTLTNKTLTTPVIASIYQDAGKTQLMTLPNTANDTLVGLTATQTLTNKTLTSPVLTTAVIDDTDAGLTVTSVDQTHGSATVTVPDIGGAADNLVTEAVTQTLTNKTLTSPVLTTPLIDDTDAGLTITSVDQTDGSATATVPDIGAADSFVLEATTQTLTNKTLTSPVIDNPLIDDGDAGLTVTSADQSHGTPTLTIPDIVGAADIVVTQYVDQTLTNKTLTAPVVNTPNITFGVSAHNYGGTDTDWTLSAGEQGSLILTTTNTATDADIIAPATEGKVYVVVNSTGGNITIKAAGQSGITVATTKTAIVWCNGTDYVRMTDDA